jgi:phosphoribosylglycinamide formyltransferase 1
MMSNSEGPARPPHQRLAVLLSGSGRTLRNLAEAIGRGQLDASIALVIASRPCPGAQWAREQGLTTLVIPGTIPAPHLDQLLTQHRIDWVVLAGYLKLIDIPRAYRGRIVNIHPALLPEFGGPGMYGPRVHEAVIHAGATVSGCTVHLCDEAYDTGRIILQKRCPVLPGDTPDTLAARIFELECQAYPEALRMLFEAMDGSAAGAEAEPGEGRR